MTLSHGVLGAAAKIIWAITVKSAAAYCETPRAFPCLNQAPRQPRRRDGLTGSGVASEGVWRSASGGLFLPQPEQALTPEEAPLLTALEKELGSSGLTDLRAKLAAFIEELSRSL